MKRIIFMNILVIATNMDLEYILNKMKNYLNLEMVILLCTKQKEWKNVIVDQVSCIIIMEIKKLEYINPNQIHLSHGEQEYIK